MFASTPLWRPDAESIAQTRLRAFIDEVDRRWSAGCRDYDSLWRWSVSEPQAFWTTLWDSCQVIGERGQRILENGQQMPGARWFPEARLNYAENLLRHRDDGQALVFWGEDRVKRRLTRRELYDEVSRCAQALRALGIGVGDRVAAYLPNMPEALIAMLATASLGAIWSSASPDFGVQGVLDRFGQIEPQVLLCTDGYWYNGKAIDCSARNVEIAARIPSLRRTVVVSYLDGQADIGTLVNGVRYADFIAPYAADAIDFVRLPFDHPLFIMFSSGTTGVPKCIVHGHGGTLLQHLKEHQLHGDLRAGDRLFYFTTCGWMMWNWLVSGLASGVTLLLYDGSPFAGASGSNGSNGRLLFDYADSERMTHFGTSAKFIDAVAKAGLRPRETHRLAELRVIFSTGSPLVPESFDFVYRHLKTDVLLASISGGTDILSCFALGNPLLPVYRGELQCRGLGMAVDVFDDDGRSLPAGERGELVCTAPFPSMPIGFWNDPDGRKYRAAYFERF
ncbi:MAG TPA: acetoacetate--CoA ligase, partial [Accumulibacter sp.]|nr:acetoacetate--CoA ligase [Accumulibacter sp.]